MILYALAAIAGVVTCAIHYTGARGAALPGVLPVIGHGLYADVWPLDTIGHTIAGVSLGSLAYAILAPMSAPYRDAVALALVICTGLAWEYAELRVWNEDAKGRRRWFEDTQADMLAVILGTVGVGVLVAVGGL